MTEYLVALGSALWLGILTSISPCPLATNIVAISYIGRRVDNARHVLLTGLLYTLGRTLAYVALAVALLASLQSVPPIALFLQRSMHLVLGPILILVGMCLLGLIELSVGSQGVGGGLQRRVDMMGVWGALLLGVAFAMTFCPVAAALFFGSLIPLSLQFNSSLALPVVYGLGTALPVTAFAVLLATSAHAVGRAYNLLAKIEWWARGSTGVAFVAVGLFLSLRHVFQVL